MFKKCNALIANMTLSTCNKNLQVVLETINNMIVEVFRHTAANVNFHIKTFTKEADSKTAPRAVKESVGIYEMDRRGNI